MILSLVRHAETLVDPSRNPSDWPLSDRGRADSHRLALQPRWRDVTRVISSAESKAVETGRGIAGSAGVALETCSGLNEARRPSFRSDYADRVEEFFRFPARSCDDWETAEHALARIRKFIQTLGDGSTEGHVVLVGHGMLWTLARGWLLGQDRVDPKDWRAILMPDVSVWEMGPSGTTLISDFEGVRNLGNAAFER